ncbi:MAG: hypothetical protein EAS51_00750 [Microbacteriaceae bacterium]|nr:MAG: hypothetical protein EAS51_00750 [Microbacteriaceae bacterium]
MSYAPARARSRAPWIAALLVPLLALASVLVPVAPASAVPGDVAGATLQWGFKASFRTYLANWAEGTITGTGVDTATPYGWSGGTGSVTDGLGTVSYPGTLHFQGHPGTGVPEGEYALDITVSNVRVRVTSAATAELVADVVSRDSSTHEFVSYADVALASLDLAAGTNASTATTVAYTGVPATLLPAGVPALGGSYTAGTVLDPVSFSWPVEQAPAATPTLTVSQTSGLNPDGATITITGTDYNTDYANGHGGGKAGVYLQIGWLDSTWRPSEGAPSSARNQAFQRWVKENPTAGLYHQWVETSGTRADFSITTTITKAQLDAIKRDGATLAVFTVGAGGVVQADNEHAVPITFATPGGEPGNGGEPGTGGGQPETPTMGAGSLSWGVKGAWRSYITGPIASGSIITSGATAVGGTYVFPQIAEASLANGLGTVSYGGSVRFTGHHGELDLRFANPQVRIDSATSGTLYVTVNGSTVAFANLALGSATRTVATDGSVRYAGVPATLTAAGSTAFRGYYAAGDALDPVTFTVGAKGAVTAGTATVASAPIRGSIPATPPATEGLDVTGDIEPGGRIEASASGFRPNETGILVVIYSTPTVLAQNVTADANGVATWAGKLPKGLTGTHTLTFQGSVARGAVLNLDAVTALAALQCTVEDATLVWGFKESFRAYIDGSIANGEWTTVGDDVSYETPEFTWVGGTGSSDGAEALDLQFAGGIRFTGHGGILDTTVENPRIVIDGDSALLIVDIHGTTQSGEAVDQAEVEFGELDLTDVTAMRDGDTLTWTGVPATLTESGSAAFGTYPAGEALDPLTIVATVDADCGEVVETPDAAPTDEEIEPEAASDAGWPVWATVLIALLLAAIIAAVAVILVRRRKA